MSMDELKRQIKPHWDKLPKNVQDAILSVEYAQTLKDIVTRYRLHIDQAADLDTETTLVMLGLETPEEYGKNLVIQAHIEPEIALQIEKDVNDKIFLPISVALHDMLIQQQGTVESTEKPHHEGHDLTDVKIVAPTNTLPHRSDLAPSSSSTQINFAQQKLEGVSGVKKTETVVDDTKPAQKAQQDTTPTPPKKQYPGGFDPYHEIV